jgi:hypothetical protein
MKVKIFITFSIMFVSLFGKAGAYAANPQKEYVVWAEQKEIYEKPDLKQIKKYGIIIEGNIVRLLGEETKFRVKKDIHGIKMYEPLVKVQEMFGSITVETVWVFKGALLPRDPDDAYCKIGSVIDNTYISSYYKENADKVILSPNVPFDIDPNSKERKRVVSYEMGDKIPGEEEDYYKTKNPLPENTYNCVFAGDKYLQSHKFLDFKTGDKQPLTDDQRKMIEADRKMEVENSWRLAQAGPEHDVYAVLFKPRGKKVIASMVLLNGKNAMYHDMEGEIGEDGKSYWGYANDQGGFPSDRISVAYIIEAHDGWEMIYHFEGGEGDNVYWVKNNGKIFYVLDHGYNNIVMHFEG